jgi:hypothetical protein
MLRIARIVNHALTTKKLEALTLPAQRSPPYGNQSWQTWIAKRFGLGVYSSLTGTTEKRKIEKYLSYSFFPSLGDDADTVGGIWHHLREAAVCDEVRMHLGYRWFVG